MNRWTQTGYLVTVGVFLAVFVAVSGDAHGTVVDLRTLVDTYHLALGVSGVGVFLWLWPDW